LGTTSLRKTVFKNHYAEKIKEMGTEPSTVKGGVPSISGAQRWDINNWANYHKTLVLV
jgi:hypothetical protein